MTAVRRATPLQPLIGAPAPVTGLRWYLDIGITCLVGLCLALPTIGSGDALAQAAHELEPPRVQGLWRAARVTLVFALCVTALTTFLFVLLVPPDEQGLWVSTPLAGIVQHLAGPGWLRSLLGLALIAAALLMLTPAAHAALGDAEALLERLAAQGTLPEGLAALHSRFGTPARAMDVAAASTVLVILAGNGRVQWLTRAYAIAVAVTVVIKALTLLKLRRQRAEPGSLRTATQTQVAASQRPIIIIGCAAVVGTAALVTVLSGDGPSIGAVGLLSGLVALVTFRRNDAAAPVADNPATLDLLPAADLSLDHIDARVGNVLVPVRNPQSLNHLTAALQAARGRDVVVMTVRLVGLDVAEDGAADAAPTAAEQRLLSEVIAVAERQGRPVRLLIVPAHNVFDAIVSTSSACARPTCTSGSSSLSADEQARLLGEAWEDADKPEPLDVHLVVYHRSGRTDTYHLGAHPPSLTPRISTRSIGSGSISPRPSALTSTTTTWSAPPSDKWNSN